MAPRQNGQCALVERTQSVIVTNEVICGVLHIALASLCDILLFIYSYSTAGTNIPFINQFYISRVNLISCVGMELVLLFSEFNKGVVTKTELFRA
jgi:hypothetical protein